MLGVGSADGASLRRTLAVVAMGATTAWAGIALAADTRGRDVATPSAPSTPARTEVQWLQAIQNAARSLNYSGTIVYQVGSEGHASRLIHMFDAGTSYERVQTLDGKPREYLRRGGQDSDEVQCLLPELRQILVERRGADFPALSSAPPSELMERYTVTLGLVERLAGLECQEIVLQPKDSLRYGYRLWVEQTSGLLLKAQTLNERNEVIEQMAFSDVSIGERTDKSRLKPAWSTEGWTVSRSEYQTADLRKKGWAVAAPPGFRKTKEIARKMGVPPAERHDTMQVVFSDGLATVSVFIEPALDATTYPDAVRVRGPTSAFARRVGESIVTVVGEVPPMTVWNLANSVEFHGSP